MHFKNYAICARQILLNIRCKLIYLVSFLGVPAIALADSSESPIGQGLSYFINTFVYGQDGIIIATIAIAGVGIACIKHVLEWRHGFYTIAGISIIYGSPAIVQGIKALIHNS